MNKKYFFAVIITLSLLGSAACHSITGSAEVREKIVDCDADLPLDELHRCIEKEAEKYNPAPKDMNAYISCRAVLKDIPAKKIDYFKSIKQCYEKDKCIFITPIRKKGNLIVAYPQSRRYDDFNRDIYLSINRTHRKHSNHIFICANDAYGYCNNTIFQSCASRYDYIETGIRGNDFIIAKEKGKENIYVVALNAVALNNKKYLIVTNVLHLSKLNVEEMLKLNGFTYPYKIERFRRDFGKETWEDITVDELKNILSYAEFTPSIRDKRTALPEDAQQRRKTFFSLSNQYSVINGYRFYTIKDSKDIKEISISLDKRKDPSKIYIKQDADVYEIDIKH